MTFTYILHKSINHENNMPGAFETKIHSPYQHRTFLKIFVAFYSERDSNLFSGSRPTLPVSYGTNTRRKPILLLRLPGSLLLRLAERQFCALLFQLPPRSTRFEPMIVALFDLKSCDYFCSEFFSISVFCKSY